MLPSQEVGVLLVTLRRNRRSLAREYCPKTRLLHYPAYLLFGDIELLKCAPDFAVAIERPLLEFLEDGCKNRKLARILRALGLVVVR